VTYVRHLAAVLLAVTVIVAGGLAWEHSSAASLLGVGHGPPGRHLAAASIGPPGKHLPSAESGPHFGPAAPPDPSNLQDLIRTLVIVAVIVTVVAGIDSARRRRRRASRTGTPHRTGDQPQPG
jgi:hypothetical protein